MPWRLPGEFVVSCNCVRGLDGAGVVGQGQGGVERGEGGIRRGDLGRAIDTAIVGKVELTSVGGKGERVHIGVQEAEVTGGLKHGPSAATVQGAH